MKHILPLSLIALILLFTACDPKVTPTITYEENIKKNLRLSHVFVPPTNAYSPYTLLQYIKGEGYMQICEATEVTGLSKENLKKEVVLKNLSNSNIQKRDKHSYGVNFSQKGIAHAGINYQDIKNVIITLEKGKLISIPSVHAADAKKNILLGKCLENIKLFQDNNSKSIFLIPMEIYQYNIKYAILDKNGINITAKLSPSIQKVVLANAGVKVKNEDAMTMDGEELYIGFKGLSIGNGMIPKGMREKSFLDVTSLVKQIKK